MRTAFLCACTFLCLAALTGVAWVTVPGFKGQVSAIMLTERPPGPDYYLAYDRGGHLDLHVLYHGTDAEAIVNLKRADVLFLGSSRMMFALRTRVLGPWARAHGVTYYALGFGFREGDAFALDLIRKHDLHPKLVVVNVDRFFGRPPSDWADVVEKETAFAAYKRVWEGEITHDVRQRLHRLIPNWFDLYGRPPFPRRVEFIAYRSRTNGTWFISPWPEAALSEAPSEDYGSEPVGSRTSEPARAFKGELDARGSRLVLTYVPTGESTGGNPIALGDLLGVPTVGLGVDGLTSFDGSHLDEESALAWSRRVTDDLMPLLPRSAPR